MKTTFCLALALLIVLGGLVIGIEKPGSKQQQANINHVFDVACQRAGGVTVPSIEPGLVHCVQPVDGILETLP